MTLSPISTSKLAATYTSPMPAQQQQQTKAPQKAPVTDIVTISKQAQQLASDGDPKSQEAREGGSANASETARGKA